MDTPEDPAPNPPSIRRALRLSSGIGLLVAGAAMMVLPGPGVVTMLAGLALLERDLPAARRVTGTLRRGWSAALRWVGGGARPLDAEGSPR